MPTIKLKCKDRKTIKVDVEIAKQSDWLNSFIVYDKKEDDDNYTIKLVNVDAATLKKVN